MIENFSKTGPKLWQTCFLTVLRNSKKNIPVLLLVITVLGISNSLSAGETLSLTNAIELAMDHSFQIKAAWHDSAAAAGDYKAARARRLPSLSVSASTVYISKLIEVTTFPTPLEIGSKENYQTDFQITIPLYTGGKISRQINASNDILLSKSFQYEAEKLATAYNCRKTYLGLLRARALVNSTNASLDRIETINKNVVNLHHNGLADSIDILDARLARYQVERSIIDTETNQGKASASLASLLGVNNLDSFDINYDVPDPAERYPKIIGDFSKNENFVRPEIKSLIHIFEAAGQMIKAKRAEYFPDIGAFAGYSIGKPNRDFFQKRWDDYFTAGLSLNWKFNFGGRTGCEISSARHAFYSAQMAEEELRRQLSLEAEFALENLRAAYHIYKTAESEHEIASSKYRLGQEMQISGGMSTNRLVELEAELTAAEQMYRASIIDYYLAETEYLYATGSPEIYGGL